MRTSRRSYDPVPMQKLEEISEIPVEVELSPEPVVWSALMLIFGAVVFIFTSWTQGFALAIPINSLIGVFFAYSASLGLVLVRLSYLKLRSMLDPNQGRHRYYNPALFCNAILCVIVIWTTIRLNYYYIHFKDFLHLTDVEVVIGPAVNFQLIMWNMLQNIVEPFNIAIFVFTVLFILVLENKKRR